MAGSMAALSKIGYRITRQTGSHLRLTLANPSQQHITDRHAIQTPAAFMRRL